MANVPSESFHSTTVLLERKFAVYRRRILGALSLLRNNCKVTRLVECNQCRYFIKSITATVTVLLRQVGL